MATSLQVLVPVLVQALELESVQALEPVSAKS
jgi:hypothetical protein